MIRLCVAALAGAVIALVVTALVLYTMFAAGGYPRDSLVELPLWAIGVICGAGALAALVLVCLFGRSPLPVWVRPMVVGGLAGVAAAVVATLSVANTSGESSKGQSSYQRKGLVYG